MTPVNESVAVHANLADEDLLNRAASTRDTDAFVEFVKRHEHSASSLAFHITGNADDASEAVQEALIRVWAKVADYRGDGTPRSWFLRIVARESLRHIRKRKRHAMQSIDESNPGEAASADRAAVAGAEDQDTREGLRHLVDALPETDRQLLALHFGGGLSQGELAKTFSITQQAVSARIKKILGHLRVGLGAAGFGAALPLLNEQGLGDLFHSGHRAPPHLAPRLLKQLQRSSLRAKAPARGSSAAAKSLWAVALFCVAAGGWYLLKQPAAVLTTAPAAPSKLYRKWTFEKGPPADLQDMVLSTWTWHAADGERPARLTPEFNTNTGLRLPVAIDQLPVAVTVSSQLLLKDAKGNGGTCVQWFDKNSNTQFRRSGYKVVNIDDVGKNIPTIVNYVFGRYVVQTLNGQITIVDEYPAQIPARDLALIWFNEEIEGVEIKSIEPADLPPETNDMPRLLKSMVRGPVLYQTNPPTRLGNAQ